MAVAAPLFLRDIVEFDRSTLHHEVVPVVRAPESGAGWREEYIGKRAASFASASEALALGYSVLVLDDVATDAECEALRREASGLAEAQRAAALAKGALPKDPERCRLPVLDHLGASGLATYDAVAEVLMSDHTFSGSLANVEQLKLAVQAVATNGGFHCHLLSSRV